MPLMSFDGSVDGAEEQMESMWWMGSWREI
jgi:hypothetical protein